MFVFILWVLLSVLTGKIASDNGRSAVAWFFVSALFSPLIGLICVLIAGKK